jgi:hypothetical protein
MRSDKSERKNTLLLYLHTFMSWKLSSECVYKDKLSCVVILGLTGKSCVLVCLRSVLFCSVLFCSVLFCSVPFCSILFYFPFLSYPLFFYLLFLVNVTKMGVSVTTSRTHIFISLFETQSVFLCIFIQKQVLYELPFKATEIFCCKLRYNKKTCAIILFLIKQIYCIFTRPRSRTMICIQVFAYCLTSHSCATFTS